jgi:hypothetical protein
MLYNLSSPCGNCPFRSDKRFNLRAGRMVEILRATILGNSTFTCHKTAARDDEDGEHVPHENEQHCAGVLILAKKSGALMDNVLWRLAVRFGGFDPGKLKMDAPIYDSLLACIKGTEGVDRARRRRSGRE